ncbi:MAG: prenyltransferase/squalene oxidase [uncultured bacterium]|nr:MAG: prenyltransferase/squalene oxidase [uncultured bacterium]
MKKIFLKLFLFFVFTTFYFLSPTLSLAVSSNQSAIDYLKAKQDATGQITGGSTGNASPWATIAFSANTVDPSTVQNPTNTLIDYLRNTPPNSFSSATEWEKWILAITANELNPYDFGGINYVESLKSSTYYNNNQIGNSASVNDDWFGVLALISSGVDKTDLVLTNSLAFILAHQNIDGGYGYSTNAGSDGNDTAAAIQALVAAKNYGVINSNLESSINNAKTYLLGTQDVSTGGFLYDTNPWTTAPDSDSTTWALMALNSLDMKDSEQVNTAKNWLLSQQANDGGFQACQYNPPDYVCQLASNSTTTSHALIGLAGKYWIINIFDSSTLTPTPTLSITPTIAPTSTPTLTPTATLTPTPIPVATATPQPTSTPTPTVTPTPTPSPTIEPTLSTEVLTKVDPTPTPGQILGVKTNEINHVDQQTNKKIPVQTIIFFGLGLLSLIIHKGII